MNYPPSSTNTDCPIADQSCHCFLLPGSEGKKSAILGYGGNCSAISDKLFCRRFDNGDKTIDLCQCDVWPTEGRHCDYVPPKWYFIPAIYLLITIIAIVCSYRNIRMTLFLLRHHNFKFNSANVSSICISIAILPEIVRHFAYFLRATGAFAFGNGSLHTMNLVAITITTFFGSASLTTLSLAWVEIAQRGKLLKQNKKEERGKVILHLKSSKIIHYILLWGIVIAAVLLFAFDKVSHISVISMVVQMILLGLMIRGKNNIVEILPPGKPGEVNLKEVISKTVRFFALSFVCLCSGSMLYFYVRKKLMNEGKSEASLFLVTLSLSLVAFSTQTVGFLMFNFFWFGQTNARKREREERRKLANKVKNMAIKEAKERRHAEKQKELETMEEDFENCPDVSPKLAAEESVQLEFGVSVNPLNELEDNALERKRPKPKRQTLTPAIGKEEFTKRFKRFSTSSSSSGVSDSRPTLSKKPAGIMFMSFAHRTRKTKEANDHAIFGVENDWLEDYSESFRVISRAESSSDFVL